MNRQTGEGFADDDVKTTYSDLKPQPNGALLANSDPIHVTAQHMTATKQPGIAHYTGNVRLWQTANVVRAPKMDFDNVKRSILAESDKSQTVSSLFVQQSQDGKLTPGGRDRRQADLRGSRSGGRATPATCWRSRRPARLRTEQLDVYLKQADPDARMRQTAQKAKGTVASGRRHARARSTTWSRLAGWW